MDLDESINAGSREKHAIPFVYSQWILRNTVGWIAATIGLFTILTLLLAPTEPPWDHLSTTYGIWMKGTPIELVGLFLIIIGAIAGAVAGLFYGHIQHSLLINHFKHIPGWRLKTILNWSLGVVILASITWLVSALDPTWGHFDPYSPPDPRADFNLESWLSNMNVGTLLGILLSSLTQSTLLHEAITSRNAEPGKIRRNWIIASIIGGLVPFITVCPFNLVLWKNLPREIYTTFPYFSLLGELLFPGIVISLTQGIVLKNAIQRISIE
jgi:hypothetical protein